MGLLARSCGCVGKDTYQKQEGSESQLIGANQPHCLRRGEREVFGDVGDRRKQRTVQSVEREHDYGLLGKGMHKPIVERIKELSTRKQYHECEFSSFRGISE